MNPIASLKNGWYRFVSILDRRVFNRAKQFHRADYDSGIDRQTYWLGKAVWKCPFDLWICQEILFETRPDIIIECGTAHGGSALFMACICDLLKNGKVLTIDCQERPERPVHPRIHYFDGSSVDQDMVTKIKAHVNEQDKVMVLLDSNHEHHHVLRELQIYSHLVTTGNYLIVEDSNINGNPVYPSFGPGPMEAIKDFLRQDSGRFVVDRKREKFMLTYNPMGYLRKV